MAKYLLVESRDSFESNDVSAYYDLATGLARAGNEVTLLLVQNGVVPAGTCDRSAPLVALVSSGVQVLADDASLRDRGIDVDRLAQGVRPVPLDMVVDRVSSSRKIWQ